MGPGVLAVSNRNAESLTASSLEVLRKGSGGARGGEMKHG